MTVSDLDEMSREMAASLRQSPSIARRDQHSPPWVVSIDKVLNLSNDVMTESEQWFVIAKLRSSLPIQSLGHQRNITFVMPAEQVRRLREDADLDTAVPDFASTRRPTHQLTATFRSLTRAQAKQQTELYYCEFELIDLERGEPVWTDRVEYKRAAKGHVWD